MLRTLLATFALAALLAPLPASATLPSAIASFRQDLDGLKGRFVQRVFDAQGNQREESSGTVALKAPRLFRWEYEQPFPQLIVADGDHVWIHDPDLEQVTVRPQSYEEQQSPLAVLIDPDLLQRQFVVKEAGTEEGLQWVELTPKGEDDRSFERARLGFRGSELVRMQLLDTLGQQTVMDFSQWRRNPDFAPDTFTFDPPPGTDVVGEALPSAEVRPLED